MNRVSIGQPIWRQAYLAPSHFQNNARLLSIEPLGTNFNESFIKIQNFSFTKTHLKISTEKWRPFFPGGNELTNSDYFAMTWSLSGSCAKHHADWIRPCNRKPVSPGAPVEHCEYQEFIAKSKSFNAPSEMRSPSAAWSCDKVWGIRIGKKSFCPCMQLAHFDVILGQFVQSKLHLMGGHRMLLFFTRASIH